MRRAFVLLFTVLLMSAVAAQQITLDTEDGSIDGTGTSGLVAEYLYSSPSGSLEYGYSTGSSLSPGLESSLEKRNERLRNRLSDVRARLNASREMVETLKEKLENRTRRIDSLETRLARKKARIESLESRVESQKRKIARLENRTVIDEIADSMPRPGTITAAFSSSVTGLLN
ncbi:MAG: hypothetical protein ABEJ98_02055 [Candidatus Nanohaloarchaea archaeon]